MIWQWFPIQFFYRTVTAITIMIIVCFFIRSQCSSTKRYNEASLINSYQTAMADVLDLEIRFMPKYVIEDDDTWTSADDLDGYIFSAYFDARPEVILEENANDPSEKITWAEIRIISLLPQDIDSEQIECVYKFPSNSDDNIYHYVSASRVRPLEEHSHSSHSAFFIICDLTHPKIYDNELIYNVKQLPESIGIRSKNSIKSLIKFIDVHYPKNGMKQFHGRAERFMALCAPVLPHQYNQVTELIEFIEYYRLMGINHFTFYISSITEEVRRVLDFYRGEDIVFVLNWYLHSVQNGGFIAAMNDCLYRNTFFENYEYVAMFDIDEFLMPGKSENFSVMLNELNMEVFDRNINSKYVSFPYMKTHFDFLYSDDLKYSADELNLHTKMEMKFSETPQVMHNQSRYILQGRNVFQLENYQHWQSTSDSLHNQTKRFDEMIVVPDVALSHQYAPCATTVETDCYLKSIVIDRTAQKFANKIKNKVVTVCHTIFGKKKCLSSIKRKPS